MFLAIANSIIFILCMVLARVLDFPLFVTLLVLPLMGYALFANRTKKHNIADSCVLITGASSGLGRAMAHEAALRGAKTVILVARTQSKLAAVALEIQVLSSRTEVTFYPCDLLDPEAIDQLGQTVERNHGTPDIIINNAGAGAWLHLEETTAADVASQISCPYQAAFNVSRVFISGMKTRGSGHFVNVTSAASLVGFRAALAYGSARWAVRGFSQYLRADLASLGIGVTLINAAEISDTDYFKNAEGKAGSESQSRIPWLFQSGIVRALSFTSQQTAVASLRAVEQGVHEAFIPFHLLVGVDWINRVMPDLMHGLLRLGSNGKRQ